MQEGKQPLWAGVQLFARLTLNAGEHTANQPARLAHLDDGNDRAILVQGNEGPAQIVRLGHRGTPSIDVSDEIAIFAARPIASLRFWLDCSTVGDNRNDASFIDKTETINWLAYVN